MKKFCLLLVLVAFKILALQPPLKPSLIPKTPRPYQEPITLYYTPTVFNSLASGKQHAPLAILIDTINEEKVDTNNATLAAFLAYNLIPANAILISGHILKNLLIRTRTYEPAHIHTTNEESIKLKKIMDNIHLNSSLWSLFDVPDSPLVFLVPKPLIKLFNDSGKNLGIKQLPNLDNLLPQETSAVLPQNETYASLISWLETHKKPGTHSSKEEFEKLLSYDISKDLEKIFSSKLDDTTPIWDIFFIGHGTILPPIIGSLNPSAFNKMLSFFDHKIKTGIVYILSCSSGGQNRTLLETTKEGIQTNHNFTLILASISDSIVISSTSADFIKARIFFNNSGFIQDKGTSINNLLRYIIMFGSDPESPHGATGFPQIWFPGGYGFQTPQMVNGALTLGNVFLKTHKENNQPINIENTLVILLYPTVINVPLTIAPFNMGAKVRKEWKHLAFLSEDSFFVNISAPIQQSIIDGLKAENILPEYLSQLPEVAQATNPANPNYYLYPQFISMAPGKANYLFSSISTTTQSQGKQIAGGVLQFIRDAFFDPVKKSDHTYFIDSLTGTNDISITLAASRLLAQVKDKHPLEELLKNRANKEITLKNVIIDSFNTYIGFQIDNTTWAFNKNNLTDNPTITMRWNFGQIDNKEYEDYYKLLKQQIHKGDTTNSQKSISAILQEKQRQVLLKKAVENTRKEAAETVVKKYQEALQK